MTWFLFDFRGGERKKKKCVAVALLFDIRHFGAAAHRSTSLSVLGLLRLCTSLYGLFNTTTRTPFMMPP